MSAARVERASVMPMPAEKERRGAARSPAHAHRGAVRGVAPAAAHVRRAARGRQRGEHFLGQGPQGQGQGAAGQQQGQQSDEVK